MHPFDANLPAKLFRSLAEWPDQVRSSPMEEIGNGPLAKMVRIALSDPDGALWAYSILVSGERVEGKAIAELSSPAPR